MSINNETRSKCETPKMEQNCVEQQLPWIDFNVHITCLEKPARAFRTNYTIQVFSLLGSAMVAAMATLQLT